MTEPVGQSPALTASLELLAAALCHDAQVEGYDHGSNPTLVSFSPAYCPRHLGIAADVRRSLATVRPPGDEAGLRAALPIVLFDIDGVILGMDGTPFPGSSALVDTLMCLGYEVHFWSAGGTLHVADALQRAAIYGWFRTHDKPTYPPTEDAALKIIGRRPALQIDDDPTERVADWPFMVWPRAALAAEPDRPEDEAGLRAALTTAFEWADAHGESLRLTAQRTAISGEDWRRTKGYDEAMRYFEPVRAALAAEPDREEPGLDLDCAGSLYPHHSADLKASCPECRQRNREEPADGTHTHGGFIQGSSARVDG